MKDRFFEALHYFRHLFIGKWRHGVHSPLVYRLTSEVLRKDNTFPDFEKLEEIRKMLKCDTQTLQIKDLGAGSRYGNGKTRSVKHIAKTALAPRIQAQALYKLIHYFKPQSIIELGTSLGLTTMYLARGNREASVYTIEGSPEIASYAENLFIKNNEKTIISVTGSFDEKLPEILDKQPTWDCIYIDGNHSYEATMRYYAMVESKLHTNSIVILDDIHWSKDMYKAWLELIGKKEVSLSLDFFHFGVLIYQNRMTKEHFHLDGLLFPF